MFGILGLWPSRTSNGRVVASISFPKNDIPTDIVHLLIDGQANRRPLIDYIGLAVRQIEAERNLAGEINGRGI